MTTKDKAIRISAIVALSALALVGCSNSTPTNDPSSTETAVENQQESKKTATAEGAADYANEFFAELLKVDTTDYSKLKLPVDLTEDQMEQLMFEGKVKDVSDKEITELVDFLYESKPIAKFIYVDDSITNQEKMQILSVLTISQSFASELSEDQTPQKVMADDVTIQDNEKGAYATFGSGQDLLAPRLVFANEEWKVDGKELLASMIAQAESSQK